jgi:hypothetical protein
MSGDTSLDAVFGSEIQSESTLSLDADQQVRSRAVSRRRFRQPFTAPLPGALTIRWDATVSVRHHRQKQVTIASGRRGYAAAGSAAIAIRLTSAGRRLTAKARSLHFTALAKFVALDGRSVLTYSFGDTLSR